ncbi:hypothetical protein KC353_g20021, partial [Hortaea werneckii]
EKSGANHRCTVPESIPKVPRKTLAERAGEPIHPARSHIPPPTTSKASAARAGPSNGYRNGSIRGPSHRPMGAARHARMPSAPNPAAAQFQDDEEEEPEVGVMGKRKAWDTKGRLEDMEKLYENLKTQLSGAADSKTAIEESLSLYKARVQELSQLNQDLSSSNKTLGSDLERARNDLHTTATDLRNVKRDHERDIQEVERKHERDLADVASKLEKEVHLLQREREKDEDRFKKEIEDAKAKWQRAKDDETADLTTQHWEEMEETQKRHRSEKELLQKEVETLKSAADSRAIESADEV